MKRALFVDLLCPAPYASGALVSGGKIGGVEQTVVRVAEALGARHRITVAQHNRGAREESAGGNVAWVPLAEANRPGEEYDAVVMIRSVGSVRFLARHHLRRPLFAWLHDWCFPAPGGLARLRWQAQLETRVLLHSRHRVKAIAVSAAHADNVREYLSVSRLLAPLARKVEAAFIYNPVSVPAAAASAVDRDKLVFFSAPWKGLSQVLTAFAKVRARIPQLRLVVARPGYASADAREQGADDGVVHLGALAHAEVLAEVRSALCTFYPASQVPETFGLVFAESDALGTPVLAHPFGAAPEVLTPEQLIDAGDIDGLVARLEAWRSGARPVVRAKEEFHIDRVAREWEELLF